MGYGCKLSGVDVAVDAWLLRGCVVAWCVAAYAWWCRVVAA